MDMSVLAAASDDTYVKGMPSRVERVTYIGKLLLPGNDLTVTVEPSRIAVHLDGRLAKIGRARRFIDAFVSRIRSETKADFAAGCERIHIIGIWHANGPNAKSFEPYLVQKANSSGTVTTSLYRYNIFHFDHHRSGERHGVTIEDLHDPREAIEFFETSTECLVPRDELPDAVLADGHPCGILWCPVSGEGLPSFAYQSVGLSKYRTTKGEQLSADDVDHFDAVGYWSSRQAYTELVTASHSISESACNSTAH